MISNTQRFHLVIVINVGDCGALRTRSETNACICINLVPHIWPDTYCNPVFRRFKQGVIEINMKINSGCQVPVFFITVNMSAAMSCKLKSRIDKHPVADRYLYFIQHRQSDNVPGTTVGRSGTEKHVQLF